MDGRPKKVWQAQRIPGALSFSWEDYTQTDEKKIPYRVMPHEKLSSALGNMGIDETTPVAVYGDADTSWGGEGWACWVLVWLGHKGPVRLLSGGIQKWQDLGNPLENALPPVKHTSVAYTVSIQKDVIITAQQIKNMKMGYYVVDTRSTREWLFESHLPEAVHINWKEYLTGAYSEVISRKAFLKLMKDNDIKEDRPVIYYCTGGVRSAYAWFVHKLYAGNPAMNFEGGVEEWNREK